MARTYLDWNASAPLRPEARRAMADAMDVAGNPSSAHAEGRAARALRERAREQVAALVGAEPDHVAFTSGATEAVNWALRHAPRTRGEKGGRAHGGDERGGKGAGEQADRPWAAFWVLDGEHAAVTAAAHAAVGSGAALHRIPLHPLTGDPRLDHVDAAAVTEAAPDALICLWEAQGETGAALGPGEAATVSSVSGAGGGDRALVFSDATQLVGKSASAADGATRAYRFDTDLAAVSAHKFGGPKGVGALLIRSGLDLPPLIHGGGQELRRRSGTENVLGLVGMGAAAAAALADLRAGLWEEVRARRERLWEGLAEITPSLVRLGGEARWRLDNTLALSAPGRKAESLLIQLDLSGLAVSAGSACSSGKLAASPVIAAMGLSPEIGAGTLRFSLGPSTTEADVDAALRAWSGLRLR
ncbi:MAG: aminotransferase class V-fold PLP-dependent enzyme [Pseudomonadota bacterium]